MYAVTLETGGGRFSEREENVAHDSGASDARGSDDVEDAIHVLPQVLLRTDIEREMKECAHTHTHTLLGNIYACPCLCHHVDEDRQL